MATDTQREKRRLILRAAISVFAHHGYHTSRVADVAREAGVVGLREILDHSQGLRKPRRHDVTLADEILHWKRIFRER